MKYTDYRSEKLKRSARRGHEERVKEKFKRIVKRWAGTLGDWLHPAYGNKTGADRLKWIDRMAAYRAHHNKCPCEMCKGQRYEREPQPHRNFLDEED